MWSAATDAVESILIDSLGCPDQRLGSEPFAVDMVETLYDEKYRDVNKGISFPL